jgi:hypothetical protein
MALNDETEAVFKSVRGQEIDPVSGNEVPLGSEPEEVRDDIDAKLSEGEYVVPADVVKYFGVKFFEDLRSQAKMGFSQMDANGRIGGEPVVEDELPFDVSELEMEESPEPTMNKGGYMTGYAEGGSVNSGFEIKEYEDENGNIIYIQFMNGTQLTKVPSGYKPKGEATTNTEPVFTGRNRRKKPIATAEYVDWMEAPVDDFEKVVDTLKNPIGNAFTSAFDILSSGTPLGFVKGLGMKNQNKQMLKGIDAQLNNPFISEDQRDRLEAVQAELWDGKLQSGLLNRLAGPNDKQGVGSEFGLGASIYERMGVIDPETGMPYENTSRTPEEQQSFLTRFFNPKNIKGRKKLVDTSDSGAGKIEFSANELAAWEKVANTLNERDSKDNTRVNFQGYGGRIYNKNQSLEDAQRGEKYKIANTNVYAYRNSKNKPKIKQVDTTSKSSNNNIDDKNKAKIKSTIVNDSNKPDYSPGAIKKSPIPRSKDGKETLDSKIRRGGGFSKGGLASKPKKK